MRDQLAEVEGHLRSGVAQADLAAVPGALQPQVHAAVLPGSADLVERDGHRAECGGRLALEKAEALGEFGRNQVAQADIVGQHHEANAVERLLGTRAHLHVAGDDRDLGFEVDAHRFAGHRHHVHRAEKIVAAALVHQRVDVEAFWHLGIARLAHQFDVVEVGRTVGPLVGPWQRRHALRRVERKRMACAALVERVVQVLQLRAHEAPVVEHLLQPAGDAGGVVGEREVAGHDDQLPVAGAVLQGGEFHDGGGLLIWETGETVLAAAVYRVSS